MIKYFEITKGTPSLYLADATAKQGIDIIAWVGSQFASVGGGSNIEISQELGDNKDLVVSQKRLTEEFTSVHNSLEKKANTEGDYPDMSVGNTPPLNLLFGCGRNYFNGAYISGITWLEGEHSYILIPVKNGDEVSISSKIAIQYALLQDVGKIKNGESPIFCSGFEGRLTGDMFVKITCPADCNYIYVLRSYNGTVRDIEVNINGMSNILDSISIIPQCLERLNGIENSTIPLVNLDGWVCSLDGTASIKFTNPIVLSKDGDSIEFNFKNIIPADLEGGGYAFTRNAYSVGGVRGLFVSKNVIAIRSDDGNWILSSTHIAKNISSVKIGYLDGNILIYVNGELISTYTGQKIITFESIGDGTTPDYTTYWSGIIDSISHNGVVLDWLGTNLKYDGAKVNRPNGFLLEGQDNALPRLMAEKFADKMLLYIRGKENKYICYPLEYRYKAFSDTYPSFYDNWGIGQPYIAELVMGEMVKGELIFNSAEAELAISVANANDANEYVGGSAHGFENINIIDGTRTISFLIDNQKLGETDILSLQEIREIDVIQETSLFQSRTNTDAWATATKKWHFDNNGLRISTDVKILRNLPIFVAQFGMMGVYRHWEGDVNNPYLTNKAIKDNLPFKVFIIDDSGIPSELQVKDADCSKITTYGEKNMGFSLKIENATTKTGGGMFISTNGGAPYNKIYYTMGRDFSTTVGEHLHATQIWGISMSE